MHAEIKPAGVLRTSASRGNGAAVWGSAEGALPPATPEMSIWRWRPTRVAAAAFVLGLVVTAAFALISLALYNRNETHLLRLRAREVSSVLAATVPSIQTTLASAAELADATGGNA